VAEPQNPRPAVALRVDALARFGVGHLVRQLALAEEFAARGRRVRVLGETDVAWAQRQLDARGLVLERPDADPDAFAARLAAEGVGICVIDGYEIPLAVGRAARAAGVAVGALCDGAFGLDQDADVYVDQNLGAVAAPERHPGARWLVGPRYVLLRDLVRDRRRDPTPGPPGEAPRVLVVFGGTDPFGGCATTVGLLLATGLPVRVTAVAARPEVARALRALPAGPGQSVEVLPPADDLPGLAVACDAAVSASGTSVWELACLGVPTALGCVTDNQRLGYGAATRELCLPAGELDRLRPGGPDVPLALDSFRRLLSDAALRLALARGGVRLVDGRGRERVADALEDAEARRGA